MAAQSKSRILLAENIHPIAAEKLRAEGFDVATEKAALKEDQLIKAAKEFDAIGIRSRTHIPGSVSEHAERLLCIGAFCIGTNQIDTQACNMRGIPVFNAPYSNTRSVAELIIAEIISLSRQLGDKNNKAHRGIWDKSPVGSHEVRGRTLGIIGYGHIGSQVSVLAESFGLRVVFFDIVRKLPLGNAIPMASMEEVLKVSDFVTLHVPETTETIGLISSRQLGSMKTGSYLLNASRGTVVDIQALVEALQKKRLAGAAIDVFPKEPEGNEEKFVTQLQGLENVILTPHIGGSTEEAQINIGVEVADSFARFLKTGTTTGAVNFPQIEALSPKNSKRILNVHKNVPGVLSRINKIVSDLGANIQAQNLSTDPTIGYLLMDVERAEATTLFAEIAKLETSIKTRVL